MPLWFALDLKKRNKCKISLPTWFDEEFLNNKLVEEQKEKETLSNLPFNFFEIFHILSDNSPDDIENFYKAKSIVEEIRQIRSIKINEQIKNLHEHDFFINVYQHAPLNKKRLEI